MKKPMRKTTIWKMTDSNELEMVRRRLRMTMKPRRNRKRRKTAMAADRVLAPALNPDRVVGAAAAVAAVDPEADHDPQVLQDRVLLPVLDLVHLHPPKMRRNGMAQLPLKFLLEMLAVIFLWLCFVRGSSASGSSSGSSSGGSGSSSSGSSSDSE